MGILLFSLNQEVFSYTPERNLSAPRPSTPPVTPLPPSASQRVDEQEIETEYNEETNTPEDYTTNIFSETTEEEISSETGQQFQIFVQTGHTATPVTVAYSPDGSYILSGGRDKKLILWDAWRYTQLKTIGIPEESLTSVAFSPDGYYTLSAIESPNMNIKLWEINSGTLIRTFSGENNLVYSVAFSPDGMHFASGGADNRVLWWSIEQEIPLMEMNGHEGWVRCVSISPDGRYILSGSDDKTLKIWSTESGKELKTFRGHTEGIIDAAFSPDGKTIISVSVSESPKMWDINTGYEIKSFEVNSATSVAFSPNGQYVVFGEVGNIELWGLPEGKKLKSFGKANTLYNDVTFSPDGTGIVTTSDDNALKFWEIPSGKAIASAGGLLRPISAVSVSPDGGKLIIGQDYGDLSIWDLNSGQQISKISGGISIGDVHINSGGTRAFAGGWDQFDYKSGIKVWEVSTGQESGKYQKESSHWVQSLSLTTDEKTLLWSCGPDLFVTNLTDNHERTLKAGDDEIISSQIGNNGLYALSSNIRNTYLWNIQEGKLIKTLEGDWKGTLSEDGETAVLVREDSRQNNLRVVYWSLSENREVRNFPVGFSVVLPAEPDSYQYRSLEKIALSPDGKTLAWSSGSNIYLYNIETGEKIKKMPGHLNSITSLGFSPNGLFVYSGSLDGTTRLWSTANGKEIIQFLNFDSSEWVALTPQGYYTASENGAENLKISMEGMAFPVKPIEHLFNSPEIVQSALSGEEILMGENASDIYTLINERNYNPPFFMLGLVEFILIVLIIFGFPFLIAIIDVLRSEFVNENKQIWLLVVVFLPLIGPVLYFFIGRKQKIRN
ncbi:MAG: PLDc N-terminal domain-containing protein [Bacteroidales bacterium]|nr:PLDc N-terminal domain-containing protein [Bacteroidales bacterium]